MNISLDQKRKGAIRRENLVKGLGILRFHPLVAAYNGAPFMRPVRFPDNHRRYLQGGGPDFLFFVHFIPPGVCDEPVYAGPALDSPLYTPEGFF
jgi:hypothetical protein